MQPGDTRPEQSPEGCGSAGEGMVMAIPFRFGLVAVDVDGHAVDIEREPFRTLAFPLGPRPASTEFQHRLAQYRQVGWYRRSDRCSTESERLKLVVTGCKISPMVSSECCCRVLPRNLILNSFQEHTSHFQSFG
ncbi:MAG: hypothetical protein EA339_15480 [Rhodobacteraceae bacterium]|nr:MAG: hypothetical protein EA339_15480 [Paracoccaceae bacterium]